MHRFEKAVAASWPPPQWADCTVLIAVSGGADSVALLRALSAIRQAGQGSLMVAHLDHQLRAESAKDSDFVENLASSLQLPAEIGKIDVPALADAAGDGVEAAAREARYAFLRQTAMRAGARFVVTAHTADDQIETLLHRILRGTSVAGLAGIPRARELAPGISLLRPLLSMRRLEIEKYLADCGQTFRHDASNDQSHYFRNRLRNELLPLLRADYLPQTDQSLLRLAAGAAECREYVEQQANELLDACLISATSERVALSAARLAAASPFLATEACVQLWRRRDWSRQAMSREKWGMLFSLLTADSPSAIELPGGIRAEKKGEQLTLTPPS
ncbi:MAG: tRNA lysidine(34) synthetase TilS [Blastopirellula sp. JB062]